MRRKIWSACPPCPCPSLDTLFLSQFSAAQADHIPPSPPRMLASPVSHLSSPSPARRRKSHTSSTALLPPPLFPPFPRKSPPSFPSTTVRLPCSAPRSQGYPNLPKGDTTEGAAAPVFAATRASNLSPVYAKCRKRTDGPHDAFDSPYISQRLSHLSGACITWQAGFWPGCFASSRADV
jgi:hypothetical protein